MSDRPTGFPKTTRLDTGQDRSKRGSATPAEPLAPTPTSRTYAAEGSSSSHYAVDASASASGSSNELRLTDDIGKRIKGRYEITDVIGEGGMGVVYEAWDIQVGRKVAIKLVRSDTTDRKFLSRFRRELEITSKLRHPSTIRVFEHGETKDGRPFMVMELLTGESLADRLEQGPLDEMEALQIARQVAESLSEAHEHGVFHRDLKPDNIFIETVGVSKVVKVLDFGIAGGVDATRLTQAGEVFGTPQYMSPEQCNGLPLDHRTDIYSLCCILYEMLEGRPPFAAETPMATMLKHVRAKVPPPRHASKETAKVILMGLRKDRSKRIQTAGRFSELIGQCIGFLRAVKEGREISRVNTLPSGPSPMIASTPISAGHQRGSSGMTPTSGNMPASPSASPAEERHGRTIAIVLGLAAIALVLMMVFGDFGGSSGTRVDDEDAKDDSKPVVVPEEDAKDELQLPNNRVLVQGNVAGAQVFVDDVYRCDTPCQIEVPVGDGVTHEIRMKKDGYVDAVQYWQPKNVGDPLPPFTPMEKL